MSSSLSYPQAQLPEGRICTKLQGAAGEPAGAGPVTSLDLACFSCGVNSRVGSALGLTQGSEPLSGLGWNSHREGLEGGGSLLSPRTLLTQREGVRR